MLVSHLATAHGYCPFDTRISNGCRDLDSLEDEALLSPDNDLAFLYARLEKKVDKSNTIFNARSEMVAIKIYEFHFNYLHFRKIKRERPNDWHDILPYCPKAEKEDVVRYVKTELSQEGLGFDNPDENLGVTEHWARRTRDTIPKRCQSSYRLLLDVILDLEINVLKGFVTESGAVMKFKSIDQREWQGDERVRFWKQKI